MFLKAKSRYSVVYRGEDDRYFCLNFERLSDAMLCAMKHGTIVVQKSNDDLEYKLGKAADVATVLGIIAVLSLIGWGWLAIFSYIGVI